MTLLGCVVFFLIGYYSDTKTDGYAELCNQLHRKKHILGLLNDLQHAESELGETSYGIERLEKLKPHYINAAISEVQENSKPDQTPELNYEERMAMIEKLKLENKRIQIEIENAGQAEGI
jgi:hypothetical protein